MLAAIIFLYSKLPANIPFDFEHLKWIALSTREQAFVFIAFFIAFAVKIPIFPFHSWQPDTYTVAPTSGSMLLAGIMLKMGLYGIIRLIIPVCIFIIANYNILILSICVAGVLYAAIIAIKQNHLKRLIAFSSLSHVGLMAAALFALTRPAITGAVLQMVSHGVNVIALFMIAESIYRRTDESDFTKLGGIAMKVPAFAIISMIVILANVALPLTNSFVGEYLMLFGIFSKLPAIAIIAGFSIIFGAIYMLRVYQKTFYGQDNEIVFEKLSLSEWLVYMPIVAAIFWIGVYPIPLLRVIEPVVNSMIP